MSEASRCPRAARERIQSTFSSSCRRHHLAALQDHPRAVDLVWRQAGGHLGKIKSGCERVVRQAAALGLSELALGTVANRWGR